MTPEQYCNQFLGQYVDGKQCVGWASYYSRNYLGTPDFFNHDAKDVFDNAPNTFERILNNPQDYNQHPEEGDIIIWNGWKENPYGHIAVCSYSSNGSNFTSYDQNWPSGSTVHRQGHDYGNVKGWLRPKNRFWIVKPTVTTTTTTMTTTTVPPTTTTSSSSSSSTTTITTTTTTPEVIVQPAKPVSFWGVVWKFLVSLFIRKG